MAKNGRFWNYQTTEKLLQGAEKTIITRPWTSFPQWGAAPVSPKNIWTNPKPHDTWKSLFQARILVQNVIFALKMDYLIAPKFHQFYPIVDPRSTGSQDHNFDQICLILQECIALMTSYLHAKHHTCTGPFLYYRLHFLVRACLFLGDSRSTYPPPLDHTLDWFPIGKMFFNGLLLFVNEYCNRL